MFTLEIRLYASLKDKAGHGRIQLELPPNPTVATLRAAIITSYPVLADGLRSAIISVNRHFADDTTPIQPTDEVAIFPPVSGGSGLLPHPTYFALASQPPDLNAIHAHLRQPQVGAIITFSGYVRGQTARPGLPPATIQLNYEAYEEMALEKMGQIAHEIWAQWPDVRGIAIVQRIGRLAVGEPTTLVACAAGHRDQGAFEAARYGIDRLKEIVPVWKQEVGTDQSVWVEGDYRPTSADNG